MASRASASVPVRSDDNSVEDSIARVMAGWQATRPDLDVEQFVWEMSGIYLSHHVSHRFNRSPAAEERAHTAFHALLERARPWGKRPRPK